MQKGRGGLGKFAGGVLLPGTACIVDGEQLHFHGHGQQLRRGFTARLCTNKMAKGLG